MLGNGSAGSSSPPGQQSPGLGDWPLRKRAKQQAPAEPGRGAPTHGLDSARGAVEA